MLVTPSGGGAASANLLAPPDCCEEFSTSSWPASPNDERGASGALLGSSTLFAHPVEERGLNGVGAVSANLVGRCEDF